MAANPNGLAPPPPQEKPLTANGWAALDDFGVLTPFVFSRRAPGDDDVTIQIKYCGICKSDLHMLKNKRNYSAFPIIPGHEIVGVVFNVGSNVQRFNAGNFVGVGCMVSSCRTCESCNHNLENYCPKMVFTYGSVDTDGTITHGGYSNKIVVNEHFVVSFPEGLPFDKGAPLLCAGVSVYSPMKRYGLNEQGKHLGIVGLGGLGHIAVKFGKAFGMNVTVISSSPSKEEDAIKRLGADAFLVSSNPEQMQAAAGTMDGIINTVSATHQLSPLIHLLKAQRVMILVGAPEKPLELPVLSLITAGKVLAGSRFGGMKDTQEMLYFADKHNITADIELIKIGDVNKAMERLDKGDVRYRFVIDIIGSLTW